MSSAPGIFFDESLPTLVKKISEQFGSEVLERGLVVRDSSGRLRFLSAGTSPSDEERARIEAELAAALGAYTRADSGIAFSDEPGVHLLLKDPAAFPMQQERRRLSRQHAPQTLARHDRRHRPQW